MLRRVGCRLCGVQPATRLAGVGLAAAHFVFPRVAAATCTHAALLTASHPPCTQLYLIIPVLQPTPHCAGPQDGGADRRAGGAHACVRPPGGLGGSVPLPAGPGVMPVCAQTGRLLFCLAYEMQCTGEELLPAPLAAPRSVPVPQPPDTTRHPRPSCRAAARCCAGAIQPGPGGGPGHRDRGAAEHGAGAGRRPVHARGKAFRLPYLPLLVPLPVLGVSCQFSFVVFASPLVPLPFFCRKIHAPAQRLPWSLPLAAERALLGLGAGAQRSRTRPGRLRRPNHLPACPPPALTTHCAAFSPPTQVLACLPPTPWAISEEELAKRRDFRQASFPVACRLAWPAC